MEAAKILWADDELDLLKPQVYFLEKKGYRFVLVSNGHDALEEYTQHKDIDVVFLDESMPGLSGLETLAKFKAINPNLPVVMITKNETENIMEEAIGSQIDDYLIKPVNPHQVLLTLKKLIDNKRLVQEKTTSSYLQDFRNISLQINSVSDLKGWIEIYKGIIGWELKLDQSENTEMTNILATQKTEANNEFAKFVGKHYQEWIDKPEKAPIMSHRLIKEKIIPLMAPNKTVVMILLDNLRFDQWKAIEPKISERYRIHEEEQFISILPTSTQYSRNAIFAGMLPAQIEQRYEDWWLNDNEKGGKNMHESELLEKQLARHFKTMPKFSYNKITQVQDAKALPDAYANLLDNQLSVIVYNFIDMLSHARTEMEVLKELAGDEKAYRSLTSSWFSNSPLWALLQKLAEKKITVVITTDHGTIRVKSPVKVVGDRETTTNLRYKVGRNLNYDRKDVFEIKDPKKAGLPSPNLSSTFIFTKNDGFFLYPNNYNYYHNYFLHSFQHGGISMEEMICPIITLFPK
ncbi:MAG: PglZ domain-containing protein [Saprospiraceae bacterium]|jgi:CheY-like chemotaxis protein|nr:PglZ domain-containing protein [Saprospiraceae bacterium]